MAANYRLCMTKARDSMGTIIKFIRGKHTLAVVDSPLAGE
jgi:hypothetical protein